MTLSVNDRARALATFRAVSVRLMEMTAAWTPTTPEMEVKVMFGRHIWDFARQADALGHRTFELRHPEQWNLQPVESFRRLLDEVAAREDTPGRLAALYDALVPGLLRRYREYLDATDDLLDAPSVDLVSRNAADLVRQREDAVRLRAEYRIPAAPFEDLARRETSMTAIVAPETAA